MKQPTVIELREFCKWYAGRFGNTQTETSTFTTCLCGHFHTYSKAALSILRDMKGLGLVQVRNNTVKVARE